MKKILFISGTRADFGKLKPLIKKVDESENYHTEIFVTGMHMLALYGQTSLEVEKSGFNNIYKYINQRDEDGMDIVLAKTIQGLSDYVKESPPDLIVVHGDRVEAMAGAIVGSLNNILVAHVEGGEVSGTIDELIRHAVSKLSHIHFVSNEQAKQRLIQLGELPSSVFVIGSPDLDVMNASTLPTMDEVRKKYEIPFEKYHIFMYHPVTTEVDKISGHINGLIEGLIESQENFIIIYPNNDHGSHYILEAIQALKENNRFRIFPSMRFEYFLTAIKHADSLVGNSSAGVREAPFYGIPSINIGSRQANRAKAKSIINTSDSKLDLLAAIAQTKVIKCEKTKEFGVGDSASLFYRVLNSELMWKVNHQKSFVDVP
ncbi:MAG: UDP-N-acetylglucosamine 2-epimerase (hydrolyzing) [Gammaproteobacteria bacterium]|nr:UDP-N-acetylglucosamine 2-epimerase (hydrolyzing) [Gammaproteobacteria bacterium]